MHDGTDAGTGSHPKRAKISDFLALAAGDSRSCSVHIKLLFMCYKTLQAVNCDLGKS